MKHHFKRADKYESAVFRHAMHARLHNIHSAPFFSNVRISTKVSFHACLEVMTCGKNNIIPFLVGTIAKWTMNPAPPISPLNEHHFKRAGKYESVVFKACNEGTIPQQHRFDYCNYYCYCFSSLRDRLFTPFF